MEDEEQARYEKYMKNLSVDKLLYVVKLAMWMDGGSEYGLEVSYIDDEIIQFRRIKESK